MHEEAAQWVQMWCQNRHFDDVLEIGSRDVNGSVRGLFPNSTYYGIDIVEGPGVDEVADAKDYKPTAQFYDLVLCLEVFEHDAHWNLIMSTIWRAVSENGMAIITCATYPRPSHSAVDGNQLRENEYYSNVDSYDMAASLVMYFNSWTMRKLPRGDLQVVAESPVRRMP